MRRVLFASMIALALPAQAQTSYQGLCDASGAAALDERTFAVVSDELHAKKKDGGVDKLFIYERDKPQPVGEVDLNKFLNNGAKPPGEADLEGIARLGDRLYVIGSHANAKRKKDEPAQAKPERKVFFALDMAQKDGKWTFTPAGSTPVRTLLDGLKGNPNIAAYELGEAMKLPPDEEDGFNIEGLAALPEGKLAIGLRNPIPDEMALLLILANPDKVLAGEPAKFDDPIELDLGKRGIRAMHWTGKEMLIVAGPYDDGEDAAYARDFALFRWSGKADDPVTEIKSVAVNSIRPEAITLFADGRSGLLLSDDGDEKVAGQDCKDLPQAKRSFRTLSFTLE